METSNCPLDFEFKLCVKSVRVKDLFYILVVKHFKWRVVWLRGLGRMTPLSGEECVGLESEEM